MRTFHEQVGSQEPFRLSYHGSSHYNSIIATNWNYEKVFIKQDPGKFEDDALRQSKLRTEQMQAVAITAESVTDVQKPVP
jgi:hypothetical protein